MPKPVNEDRACYNTDPKMIFQESPRRQRPAAGIFFCTVIIDLSFEYNVQR